MGLELDSERFPANVVDTRILADHVTLPFSKLTLPSRFVKAAMTEELSSWDQARLEKRGIPTDELIRVYEEWGKGGYGMIITGNAMITPVDLQNPGNAIVYKPFESPERLSAFRRWAEAGKRHGALMIMQINHCGRQTSDSLNPNPVSASDVQLERRVGTGFGKPRPLTKGDIDEIVEQFAYSADFAYRAGFDGIQLHCAHGYLLAQFLSSTTNLRTDEYGGPLENRARIIYRIIEEMKRRVPPTFSIAIKINSVEFQHGGFQPEECRTVCAHLESFGVDFIELSGGTYEEFGFHHKRESTRKREAFFVEFADIIRPAVKTSKVILTGGFRTGEGMVRTVTSGSTDLIGVARPACEEPDFPNLLLSGSIQSARRTLLPEAEDFLSIIVSGTQIRQIAFGEKPFNSASSENMEKFKQVLEVHMQKLKEAGEQGVILAGGYPEMHV
ncbi:NADH oxidase [Fomitiporia mediterranea MF3/22]|uniref:NADH oxidase n=1 Tax=Fomitiporia mediterranea (strain MF3/22) TaxID=694068 RepID=UPI0004407C76|nr:NADH oxidase [Fomitiporia mediterranea MF3/22]EJC99147.1 NADH oxidase [Fomitiporia mediterranea MF3/22]